MRRSLTLLAFAAIVPLGCGGEPAQTSGEPEKSPAGGRAYREAPANEKPESAERGTVIKLADSQVGEALFDGEDQAIYLFDAEQAGKPQCYGQCAAAWPPVLTDGEPLAEGRVEQGLLGTTDRRDGSTQVTYGGHPLYYYAHEEPGELLCHNVEEFGGLWLALDQSGQPLS